MSNEPSYRNTSLTLTACLMTPQAEVQAGERGQGRLGTPPEALDVCFDEEQCDQATQ